MATSWQLRVTTLSQGRKLTSPQLSFSTLPQRCDNVDHDVVTTLSQRRCASWEEQPLKTNYAKCHSDETAESTLFIMCRVENETVSHILSECKMFSQKEYKKMYGHVCRHIHWRLCEKHGYEGAPQWCKNKSNGVIENEVCKILWDFTIHCEIKVEVRLPDIVIIDKTKKKVKIV